MNKKTDLVEYRLKESREKLESAKILLENRKYKDSVSRSYYAMFTAARALLATKNLDSAKHSGIISLFNQHFVKEKIVNSTCGKILAEAKGIREETDYGDFVIVSREEAKAQIKNAEMLISEVVKAISRNST